jgi:nicotinate phosphoribosyltransferase
LKLQPEERKRLKEACPYFSDSDLDYLQGMSLHPEDQVKLEFVPKRDDGMGEITCSIEGVWRETILYEVPILAICKRPGSF